MTVFYLTYDLINEKGSHDYEPLWSELKRLDAHRTQYSAWLINLANKPVEVTNHFKKYLDKDDRIMVTRLRKNEYDYFNAMAGTNAWLEKNQPD